VGTKYSELDDKEQQKVNDEIGPSAMVFGYDEWEESKRERIPDIPQLGLCANCGNLRACISEFGKIVARCDVFKCSLNAQDPIKDCTSFEKRGEVPLYELKEMAIILEPNKKQVGFIKDDNSS